MKLTFYCQSCSQKLNVGYSQVGTVVRCPACDTAQPVAMPLARRYHVLRIAAGTLQVLAVVVTLILLTIVLVLMDRYQLWSAQRFLKGLLVMGLGVPAAFVVGIVIYATGECCRLLVDLEDSIRSTRLHMELTRAERRVAAGETPQEQSQ